MKKYLFLVAIIGFGVATLCSCGKKSVKGADGMEYSSYQEACRHQDFVAAYDWIEKNNGSDDDKDYVFNAEMLYLTSLGTEEASNRIVYLLAEYQIPGLPVQECGDYSEKDKNYEEAKRYVEGVERFNRRCDNIIDMALTQKNKSLSEKIIKLYKQDIGYSISNTAANPEAWFKVGMKLYVGHFSWKSRDRAQTKIDEAFGKDEVEAFGKDEVEAEKDIYKEIDDMLEELAPAKPTPKKSVKSKRRRR